MYQMKCDVAVVGAGPAGLAAAVSARKAGAEKVLIVERDTGVGGILQQCIHAGFGLKYFQEELTGPEYAGRFARQAQELGVEILMDTMVLEVVPGQGLVCVSAAHGIVQIQAGSVVLAMGCRERTRGALAIPGTRPAGVYTAGAAQRMINRQNEMVGRTVVILGSGDIGMIMARRLSLEEAKVVAVVEIMDYLAGLTRNRVQCLDDFGIPLKLSHTVTEIVGNKRVEGVKVAQVDAQRRPIPGTEEFYPCDTLLLSVGLIPENELSRGAQLELNPVTKGPVVDQFMQTSQSGIFAAGNVVHVNDLVDNVSRESEQAGHSAALYAMGAMPAPLSTLPTQAGSGVRYVCPQKLTRVSGAQPARLYFRVSAPATQVTLRARVGDQILAQRKAARVSPGEMESLTVDVAQLPEQGTVIVEMEQGELK